MKYARASCRPGVTRVTDEPGCRAHAGRAGPVSSSQPPGSKHAISHREVRRPRRRRRGAGGVGRRGRGTGAQLRRDPSRSCRISTRRGATMPAGARRRGTRRSTRRHRRRRSRRDARRTRDGMVASRFDPTTGMWISLGSQQGIFADRDGWNVAAKYYWTIQFADIDGRPGAEMIGRGPDGLYTYTWDSPSRQWRSVGELLGALGDAEYGNPSAYGTIRLADIDGRPGAELIARGYRGVKTWRWFAPQYSPKGTVVSDRRRSRRLQRRQRLGRARALRHDPLRRRRRQAWRGNGRARTGVDRNVYLGRPDGFDGLPWATPRSCRLGGTRPTST